MESHLEVTINLMEEEYRGQFIEGLVLHGQKIRLYSISDGEATVVCFVFIV